jgi:transketolase C-terminal domain/subunit
VVVEDHTIWGGLGDEVNSILGANLDPTFHRPPVIKVGLRGFAESGDKDGLYDKYGLSGEQIAARATALHEDFDRRRMKDA